MPEHSGCIGNVCIPGPGDLGNDSGTSVVAEMVAVTGNVTFEAKVAVDHAIDDAVYDGIAIVT